jgi:hypothetical protein
MKKMSILLRLTLLIVLALVIASVCVAQPTSAPLSTKGQPGYQQVPSQGEQPGYPALQPPGFHQVPPAPGIPPGYRPPPRAPGYHPATQPLVVLFEDSNYGGRTKVFEGDTHWVGRDFNNIASSLLVPPGYCVILYERRDYGGRSKQFCENTPWLGDEFNDNVASFEVVPIGRGYGGHDHRGDHDHGAQGR